MKFNVLDPKDIREESPYFAHDIPGGLECETDSLINPYLFCYSLIDKAKQYGLKLRTNAEVTSIKKNEDFTIETTNGTFTAKKVVNAAGVRSEEHTSELQSRGHLVCRLLLEKKKKQYKL